MARRSYRKSPCCNALVVVPVDVTMHQLVLRDGRLAMDDTRRRIMAMDDLRSLRRQAAGCGADVNEAYCWECGRAVEVGNDA